MGSHEPQPRVADPRSREPWVVRTRLLERLARSDAEVVTVGGPAGSGKSTLSGQVQALDGRRQALVRGGTGLDDPAALARALMDALAEIGPKVGESRDAVTGEEPEFSAVLLPAIRRLAATRADDYLITIDDVHLLTDPGCRALLRALCDGVPAGSTVMLLGRHATPAWLASARAGDRLLELGPADLAFDADEVRRLLAQRDVPPGRVEVQALLGASEGWAVGVYLAVLAAAEDRDAPVPRPGDHRHVVDYLTTEILDPLDDATRTFLVRTSILEELTAPSCDAVLGRTDSAAVLPGLARRLQLVVPLDGRDRVFRYHHLLADVLRADLDRREPGAAADLHRRAATWFEGSGAVDVAIRHAKAADDPALAGRLIWANIVPCLATGRPDRLRQWLSGLDDRRIGSDRWLSMASAWSAATVGDGARQTRWVLRCEEHAGAGWRQRAGSDEYCATLAALMALVGAGGLAAILDDASAALAGLPADSGFRAPAAFLRGVCLMMLRRVEEARAALDEAERLARALDVPIIVADALSWQGMLAIRDGDPEVGARLIDAAAATVTEHHLERLAYAANAVTGQALVLALRHRRDEAAAALATARRLTSQTKDIAPWFAVTGRVVQARAAVLLGDGATARTLVAEARAHLTADLAGTLAGDLLAETETAIRQTHLDGVQAGALTDAEIRVLQYLPSHLTFPQVGQHLFVSANTVKTHVLSIYRKLGVSSRSDAVDRARRLGLVESLPRN